MQNAKKKMSFSIEAPAKINLCLHVVGRRRDNYHLISSLVIFLGIFDTISVSESKTLKLNIKGPFAKYLGPKKDNSVIKAALALRKFCNLKTGAEITLTKNLPISSGIGGGSTDCAATIKLLLKLWKIKIGNKELMKLGQSLGADVPVCLIGRPSFIGGIGEDIKTIESFPNIWILLVNPRKQIFTKKIFSNFKKKYSKKVPSSSKLFTLKKLISFLKRSDNDLTSLAVHYAPEIKKILNDLSLTEDCLLSRMSGSGATCFGIFSGKKNVIKAKKTLLKLNPNYWISYGQIVGNK